MGKIGALAVIPLVFVVSLVVSGASSRSLLADEKASPSPAPGVNTSSKSDLSGSIPSPPPKKLDQTPTSDEKTNTKKPNNQSELNDKKVDNSTQRSENPNQSGAPVATDTNPTKSQKESCEAPTSKCVRDNLVACLQHSDDESKELILLVQNTGENALNVTIKGTPALNVDGEIIPLPKDSSHKRSISTNDWGGLNIVLNAGKGDCILQVAKPFSWDLFQQIPTPTPIYGAYFLFFVVILAAGIWACCKFRSGKRHDSEVPYQQLEMGELPQSTLIVEDGNARVGWDEGWDDDWDEEAVMKPEAVTNSSEKYPVQSVSSNGITSKALDKDGWDVDWDD